MTKAPISAPPTCRGRPISDVPPITTAAIALSSKVSPACGAADGELGGDDQPDHRGAEAGDHVDAALDPLTGTPASSAARSLPPIA